MSELKPWRECIGKHEAYMIMCDVLDVLYEKEAIKKTVYERLKQAPSTDRKGHWEIYVISPFDGEGCRCSECGTEGAPYWGYCPHCGADMRGDKDE